MISSFSNQNATVKDAVVFGTTKLYGFESARLDAEIILGHVLGLSRTELYCSLENILESDMSDLYKKLIMKRKLGTPTAYITGTAYFWSMKFMVNKDVLIPRPETELLVEEALRCIEKRTELTVLDLGTGSGAIAGAIASERPDIHVLAVDEDKKAANIARNNFDRLNLHNVDCIVSDWNSALKDSTTSLIVANPPYVDIAESHLLDKEVWSEPRKSIFAKERGLSHLKTIIRKSYRNLKTSGYLVVEHGHGQGQSVRDYFFKEGFVSIRTSRDLSLLDRVTSGKKIPQTCSRK